jgi:uncharacterized FlaG/YvyC family protein
MADIQSIATGPVPVPDEKTRAEPAAAPDHPDPAGDQVAAPVPRPAEEHPVLDAEQWAAALAEIRTALEAVRPPEWHVAIREDPDTGSVVIEIQDEDGETVKQFPPEKILNLQRKLADLAGVVLDEAL